RRAVVPVGNVESPGKSVIHHVITTERLLLRPWRDQDISPFAAMNADPRVMEFFPSVRTRAETEEQISRIRAHFNCHAFGYWAVEVPGVSPFIGFVGLKVTQFEAPFSPCIDIGWRLAFEHWGHGYATEGARAALEFGFKTLRLGEIVSFTVPANLRSRRVMER